MHSQKVTAIKQFIQGMRDDIQGYNTLLEVLDRQHQAMVKRDIERLESLSSQHNQLLKKLHSNAKTRTDILTSFGLAENAIGVSKLINALPKDYADKVLSLWNELQKRVHECMRLNERNGKLLSMQQQVLSQVTQQDESPLYEPV